MPKKGITFSMPYEEWEQVQNLQRESGGIPKKNLLRKILKHFASLPEEKRKDIYLNTNLSN